MRSLRMLNRALGGLAIAIVRAYQRLLSPIMPPVCRFRPTCSQYMVQAIRKKGFIKGFALGFWRLLRCNPFGRGGYDPVP